MQSTEERFWAKVNRTDGCWEWTASRNTNGYGRMYVAGHLLLAHRIAYELFIGPIPPGLQVDHLCRNRGCCNPQHLEAVTQRENLVRGIRGNQFNTSKTECPAGHPYDAINTYVSRRGTRACKTCRAEASARWYARSKLK